jgi:P-type Cu+ transporter
VAGVVTARVNLASERATVAYLPSQVDAAMLRQAITAAGFEPRELTDVSVAADQERAARSAEAAHCDANWWPAWC